MLMPMTMPLPMPISIWINCDAASNWRCIRNPQLTHCHHRRDRLRDRCVLGPLRPLRASPRLRARERISIACSSPLIRSCCNSIRYRCRCPQHRHRLMRHTCIQLHSPHTTTTIPTIHNVPRLHSPPRHHSHSAISMWIRRPSFSSSIRRTWKQAGDNSSSNDKSSSIMSSSIRLPGCLPRLRLRCCNCS